MKLFGGLIGWRASKQDTVTTSTTEAELLALSQAAKEPLYVSRLITELSVRLDDQWIRIQCDNHQTIRLVTTEIALKSPDKATACGHSQSLATARSLHRKDHSRIYAVARYAS